MNAPWGDRLVFSPKALKRAQDAAQADDLISYTMRVRKLAFPEAVKYLANAKLARPRWFKKMAAKLSLAEVGK